MGIPIEIIWLQGILSKCKHYAAEMNREDFCIS